MYQIDWGAKSYKAQQRKALPKAKNRNLAIASFFSLQISTLAMPMISFAETLTIQSSQEDIPEEILRAEIYTDARSPIDGKQLTAAEYTELMEKLRSLDSIPPEDFVSPKVREVIGLLKLRKFLRQFIPFIP
ncbi:hypothetical protein [Pseudanabaena sp. BC1403]|uniref:hypothetical protein n=1 Tax=Pseudanabaena sp. BC1403 TaxID=2043171 RepID=UPI0021562235|nr:hypothetical protein [Pseudanabaena sp. BC1403]